MRMWRLRGVICPDLFPCHAARRQGRASPPCCKDLDPKFHIPSQGRCELAEPEITGGGQFSSVQGFAEAGGGGPAPGRKADGPLLLLVGGTPDCICGLRVWEGRAHSQLACKQLSLVVFLGLLPQPLFNLSLLGRLGMLGPVGAPDRDLESPHPGWKSLEARGVQFSWVEGEPTRQGGH